MDKMGYVCPVESFPFHNEGLRPDHILHGTNLNVKSRDLTGRRVREPAVVDLNDSIAGTENHVNKIILVTALVRKLSLGTMAGKYFSKPMRQGELRTNACGRCC